MGAYAAGHCENCGSPASFAPLFSPARSTRRCLRCGGWHYFGDVAQAAEELYDERYFFGGEYRDYDVSAPAQRGNFARKLRILDRAGAGIGKGARVLELGCATGEFEGGRSPGWATIVIVVAFFGALQSFSIGVLGEYLLRISFRSSLPAFVRLPRPAAPGAAPSARR